MANTSIRIPDKLHEELRKCVYERQQECVYGQKMPSLNSLIVDGVQMVLKHYGEEKKE
jgi:hypothetical protein